MILRAPLLGLINLVQLTDSKLGWGAFDRWSWAPLPATTGTYRSPIRRSHGQLFRGATPPANVEAVRLNSSDDQALHIADHNSQDTGLAGWAPR